MTIQSSNMTLFPAVPLSHWSKDHWSLLCYVQSIADACGYFQLGCDFRLRVNRITMLALKSGCPQPFRPHNPIDKGENKSRDSLPVMRPQHSTQLKNGTIIDNHDDLACLVDISRYDLFSVGPKEVVVPGVKFVVSENGKKLHRQLCEFRASGGKYKDFEGEMRIETVAK